MTEKALIKLKSIRRYIRQMGFSATQEAMEEMDKLLNSIIMNAVMKAQNSKRKRLVREDVQPVENMQVEGADHVLNIVELQIKSVFTKLRKEYERGDKNGTQIFGNVEEAVSEGGASENKK